jgi:hypothetical protein
MEHQDQNFCLEGWYTGTFREVRGPQIPSTARMQNLRKNRLLSCVVPYC